MQASSIEKGNAYHKLMQYVDFSSNNIQLLKQNVQELLNGGKLLDTDLKYINLESIVKLLNNKQFLDIVNSGTVLREKEFFMNIGSNDVIIVQGVVDLAVINGDGATIIDYKTGNFASAANLAKYKKQIDLYAVAIEKSFGIAVNKRAIVAIESGEVYFL